MSDAADDTRDAEEARELVEWEHDHGRCDGYPFCSMCCAEIENRETKRDDDG